MMWSIVVCCLITGNIGDIMVKKQLAIRMDESLYVEVEKCQVELKKKGKEGGISLSRCGIYLISKGLESVKNRNIER